MNKKILLVDDEEDIIEILKYNLEKDGFNVITASNGLEALDKLVENPNLIVLDIMMPKLNGFETFKKIKEKKGYEQVPILFLTAKSNEVDEILGLELGADDYIQKPISPSLLIARIKNNLRKSEIDGRNKEIGNFISTGPLFIDRKKYIITINGIEKIFPKKEFELLYYLVTNPNTVCTREVLLKNVWGIDVYVGDRTIDVHIRKVREKLGEYASLVETIKGVGYKFKQDEIN